MALSPQPVEKNREQAEQRKLRFDVLHDAGNEYARQLGLVYAFSPALRSIYEGFGLDLAAWNDDPRWELPMPARFVVDSGGGVRYAESDPDYTVRPEPAETLAALRAIRG